MPSLPRQIVRLQHGLDDAFGEIIEIKRPAHTVREHETVSVLWTTRVEHLPQRLDDGHNPGIFFIFARLGVLDMRTPD
jgi:hypothetical protein